jgi:hypothetical protein
MTENTHGGARAGAGAPLGSKNASKSNRLFGETIKRLIVQSEGEVVRQIAEALINKAIDGDMNAIKEFGDRVDGKVVQESKLSGDSEAPVIIQVNTGIDRSGK